MESIALALIAQLNSSIVILFLILIIVCVLLFKLGYWTHKFNNHYKRVEKIEGLAEKVISISTKIDLIYQNVSPNSPLKSFSPISLTPVGKGITERIGADIILKKYEQKLVHEVERLKPNNAYDIQKISLDVAKTKMNKLLNEEELITIKTEAFNLGILEEDVMGIFGILLRNHILEQRNIPIADVDKHAPSDEVDS